MGLEDRPHGVVSQQRDNLKKRSIFPSIEVYPPEPKIQPATLISDWILVQVVYFDARENVFLFWDCRAAAKPLRESILQSHLAIRSYLFLHFQIDNYVITEFVQGQTRRWAIAWSLKTFGCPDVSSQSFEIVSYLALDSDRNVSPIPECRLWRAIQPYA